MLRWPDINGILDVSLFCECVTEHIQSGLSDHDAEGLFPRLCLLEASVETPLESMAEVFKL